MKISYAICTHNEGSVIRNLLTKVLSSKQIDDEIIILDDCSTDEETINILNEFFEKGIKIETKQFANDFAEHKNYLNSLCSGDYIFNIDADEIPSSLLFQYLPELLKLNSTIDLFWVPRINTVDGLTLDHANKWKWNIQVIADNALKVTKNKNLMTNGELLLLTKYNAIIKEQDDSVTYYEPIIQPPDYQGRIYKNSPDIKWINKVHEKIDGYKTMTILDRSDLGLLHKKDIKKQELQNWLYDKISTN